jgi:hypothetical protein
MDLKINYHVYKTGQLKPALNQLNQVHSLALTL